MTLELRPEVEASLHAMAIARGISPEQLIEVFVGAPSGALGESAQGRGALGLQWEDGILVYRSGTRLTVDDVNRATREAREPRATPGEDSL